MHRPGAAAKSGGDLALGSAGHWRLGGSTCFFLVIKGFPVENGQRKKTDAKKTLEIGVFLNGERLNYQASSGTAMF